MSLARNTLVQASFTLLSRLFGFARDRAISNMMGAGAIGDAFATAQMFPNLFRRILAEGAFSQAFVPFYARTQKEQGDSEAIGIATDSFSVLTLAAAAFTILCQFAMPWIMLVIHRGYADQPEAFAFAILLTQITMPYLVGMAMSSLFAGVLNTAGKFALSAAAPTLLNLTILIAVLPAKTPEQAALNGAIAIAVAGVLQALALYIGCRRMGVKVGFRWPKLTPQVKTIMALMVPSIVAGSATQINVAVSQALASSEVGAKSWLYAADRLFQLPLGLIGVAIGVALLPRLAQAATSGSQKETSQALDEGVTLSMAFALPATAALTVIPFFLMHGFWTGGDFTIEDSRATAAALVHYGWGVPAFILVRILAPPFFARQDTKRPMRYALAGVVANVIVGAGAFFTLRHLGHPGYVGLAVGTSVAAWLNVALLLSTLLREKIWEPSPQLIGRLVRISIATLIMASALGLAGWYRVEIEAWFADRIVFGKEIAILMVSLAGFGLYGAAAFATGAVRLSDIKTALRRPAGAPAVVDEG
jgi:putative peptidoglycan lipid II flippase